MTLEVTITSIDQLTPDVKEFTLEADDHVFEYDPGQHTRVRYEEDAEGKGMARPYTATDLPGTNRITLAIKHVESGAASTYMHERDPGDRIQIEELDGGLTLEDPEIDVVFVSTGVGITPMMAMLRQYLDEGIGDVYFFFGERDQDHLIYRDTLDRLAATHENLTLVYSLTEPGDGWTGRIGNIQEHLDEYLPTLDGKHFYVCGVPQMVIDTKEMLAAREVPRDRIFSEGWEEGAVQANPSPLSIYEDIGGREAIEQAVERMYDHILADERLAPYFDESNMTSLINHQSSFIAMVAGGPDYHHHIPETHAHMTLRDEHFDAVLGHLHTAFAECGIDEQAIQQLKSQLESYRTSTVTARQ